FIQTSVPASVVPDPVTPNTKLLVVTPPTSWLNVATIGPVRVLGGVNVVVVVTVTVKHPLHVAAWVSGFVTVTSRAGRGGAGSIVMFAFTWLASRNVVAPLTVMPLPENEATAPLTKLVPVIVTSIVVPRWPVVGEAEVAVGAGRMTSKQPAHVSACVSGLVTV